MFFSGEFNPLNSDGNGAGDVVPSGLPSLVRADRGSEGVGHLRLREAQPEPGLFEFDISHRLLRKFIKLDIVGIFVNPTFTLEKIYSSIRVSALFCATIAVVLERSIGGTNVIMLRYQSPDISVDDDRIFAGYLHFTYVCAVHFQFLLCGLAACFVLSDYSIRDSRIVVKGKIKLFLRAEKAGFRA